MSKLAMESYSTSIFVIILFSILVLSMTLSTLLPVYAQEEFRQREIVEEGKPRLVDRDLKVEQVTEGLDTPTTMAFLGPNDILVWQKIRKLERE